MHGRNSLNDFWQITKAFLWYHIKSHLGINLINWSHWDCKLTEVSKNVWGESLLLYVRNSSSCMQSIVKMAAYETNIASLWKYSIRNICKRQRGRQQLNDSKTIQVLIQFYLDIYQMPLNGIWFTWFDFTSARVIRCKITAWSGCPWQTNLPLESQFSKPFFGDAPLPFAQTLFEQYFWANLWEALRTSFFVGHFQVNSRLKKEKTKKSW